MTGQPVKRGEATTTGAAVAVIVNGSGMKTRFGTPVPVHTALIWYTVPAGGFPSSDAGMFIVAVQSNEELNVPSGANTEPTGGLVGAPGPEMVRYTWLVLKEQSLKEAPVGTLAAERVTFGPELGVIVICAPPPPDAPWRPGVLVVVELVVLEFGEIWPMAWSARPPAKSALAPMSAAIRTPTLPM